MLTHLRQHYDAVTPTGSSRNSAYVHRSSGRSRKPRTGLACRNGVDNSTEQIIGVIKGSYESQWLHITPIFFFIEWELDRNPTPGLVVAGAETCETLGQPLFNTNMRLIIRKFKHQFDKRMLCNPPAENSATSPPQMDPNICNNIIQYHSCHGCNTNITYTHTKIAWMLLYEIAWMSIFKWMNCETLVDFGTGMVGRFTSARYFHLRIPKTGWSGPIGRRERIFLTTCTKHSRPRELELACMCAMSKFELTLVSLACLSSHGAVERERAGSNNRAFIAVAGSL